MKMVHDTVYGKMIVSWLIFLSCFSNKAFSQLTANFFPDHTQGCAPFTVAFSNQSTGVSPSAIYSWDFGNGNTSAGANTGAVFLTTGTYNVVLTIKDGNLSSTVTKQIIVLDKPVVDFSASVVKGCLPLDVNFTATATASNSSISNYIWDFGDGTTLTGTNNLQSHTYTVAQHASVSLTVSNASGCSNTIQKDTLIKILPALQAAFSASQTVLCTIGDPLQLINNSTGPGTLSYNWNFGDATNSSQISPSHIFNVRGTYGVTLTATSSEGCSSTLSQPGYINVANFSTNFDVPPLICHNVFYTFNSTGTSVPTSSVWQVNNVDESNSLTALITKFQVPGSYTIKLKSYFNTCVDSVSKTVVVKETPNLTSFIATPLTTCGAPVTYQFRDTTASAIKWAWNFDSYLSTAIGSTIQTPSHLYSNDGTYVATLDIENAAGCKAKATKIINITRPYVYVTMVGIPAPCGPFSIGFSATGTLENVATYNWIFGDGSTSTAALPVHYYATPGQYGVTLSYKTVGGCTGTVSYGTVTVYETPMANFFASATTVCGTTPVTFSIAQPQNGVYYSWDFGDGTGDFTAGAATHVYANDSVYSVRVIAYGAGGCIDTLIRNDYITVLPLFPKISSATNTCDGLRGLVMFTQTSRDALTWSWDFGDGTIQNVLIDTPNVSHTYQRTGSYKTVLTTTNGVCTLRDTIQVNVLLKQNPLLTASSGNICENGQISIIINNLEPNPLVNAQQPYYYNVLGGQYNDGTPFTGALIPNNPLGYWGVTFNGTIFNFERKAGIRILLISSGFSCIDSTNYVPLQIKGSESGFAVLADNRCFKLPVILKDTSKTNNTITDWQWDYGDGYTQRLTQSSTVSHIYNTPGSYIVTLIITDAAGCRSTSYRHIEVNGPKAIFSASSNSTYITLPVNFYNNSNTYNSSNTLYQWQFGDGTSSTVTDPFHAYPTPGIYTVKLIASNSVSGCRDTAIQQIEVKNFEPEFLITKTTIGSNGCPPVMVNLSNNSINYTSVKWNFGDNTTADNINYPSHVYENPGRYIITLFVYGPGGLTGVFKDSIDVVLPSGSFAVDDNDGCIGHIAHFTSTSSNTNNLTWDFGDGTVLQNINSPATHQYTAAGIYNPVIVLQDATGCATFSNLATAITIYPQPDVNITPADTSVCKGQSTTLTASGGNGYVWSPTAGIPNPASASITVAPASTSNYMVTVTNGIGCSDTGRVRVTVIEPQSVHLPADLSVCRGSTIQLNATGATNYKWISNTHTLNDTTIHNPTATPLQTTIFTVVGTDSKGCFYDTASVRVQVMSLPTVAIPQLPEMLVGDMVRLLPIFSNDVIQWSWSPSANLSCSTCPSPVLKPFEDRSYQLTVTNANGCKASATVLTKLQCDADKVFIPAAFSPNNDGNNDVFNVLGISFIKYMVIYNRWGKLVYEKRNFYATDKSNAWNGTSNGNPMEAGTYLYYVEMECRDGSAFTRKGTVVLVR